MGGSGKLRLEEITKSRCPKNPLRPLLEEEHRQLIHLSRRQAVPVSQVARAKAVLVVADGGSYTAAARAAGQRSAGGAGRRTGWQSGQPHRRQRRQILHDLTRALGKTVIAVTHDPTFANVADRRIGIVDGRIDPDWRA